MIETSVDDHGVAIVRLASPATANALTPAAFAELTATIAQLQLEGSGAKALVLTGEGRVFSAGANLDVLGVTDASALEASIVGALLPLYRVLSESRLPVIAAVNGAAVGGAVGLVLMCDIVLAARSARFSLAFAKLGLVPDTGLTYLLPRLVGEARARALMMTAADIHADQAEAIGMIYRCVDDGLLMTEAIALARVLAALPGASHRLIRDAITTGRNNRFDEQIVHEAREQSRRVLSDDFKSALAAFASRSRDSRGTRG